MSFRISLPVRFQDCDPAGIAYFPRLLALVDAAIEDWTAATLGLDRQALHAKMHLGLPTVKLETDFLSPAGLGQILDFDVKVSELGTTSVTLDVTTSIAGQTCLETRLVQVLMDLETHRPVPWPASWRDSLRPLTQEFIP